VIVFVAVVVGCLVWVGVEAKGYGGSCTQAYAGGPSPDCSSKSLPVCVNTAIPTSTAVYQCAQCASDCDCPIGKYCSQNTWQNTAGMCISFAKEGSSCYPMNNQDMFDPKIGDAMKCADIFTQGGNIVLAGQPSAAGGAQCVSGTCRICAAGNMGCQNGNGPPRVCVYPGKLTTIEKANWAQPVYQTHPDWVWLAIFFPFILCMCCTLCLMLCKHKLPIIGKDGNYDRLLPK